VITINWGEGKRKEEEQANNYNEAMDTLKEKPFS